MQVVGCAQKHWGLHCLLTAEAGALVYIVRLATVTSLLPLPLRT